MCVCKYLNQTVRKIGEESGKTFIKVFQKKKKHKHTHEEIEFLTQFKIQFVFFTVYLLQ